MRSVRLDAQTEAELKAAAELSGEPVSEIIRQAVREKCARIVGERLDVVLGDYVGSIACGGNSRHTGRDFTELLREKDRKRRRRRQA